MVCLSPVGYGVNTISHRRQTYHIDLVYKTISLMVKLEFTPFFWGGGLIFGEKISILKCLQKKLYNY